MLNKISKVWLRFNISRCGFKFKQFFTFFLFKFYSVSIKKGIFVTYKVAYFSEIFDVKLPHDLSNQKISKKTSRSR